LRGRAEVARQAHNLKVGGSIPPPATKKIYKNIWSLKKSLYICKTKQNNLKIEIMATFETYYYEAYEEHSATGDTMSVKS
jgi:hypothetical protein